MMECPALINPLEVATDAQAMSPCSIPSSLKKVYCVKEGQPTPPSSPDDATPPLLSNRFVTKIPQTKIASKRSNGTNTTSLFQRSKSLGHCNISRVAQSGTVCSPIVENVRRDTVNPPAQTEPTSSGRGIKRMSRLAPAELRRTSVSYHNLRGVAREQKQAVAMPPKSLASTPLLPSPLIDDISRNRPCDQELEGMHSVNNSYENLQILSYYEEDQSASTENSNKHGMNTTSTTVGTSILSHIDGSPETHHSSHVRCKNSSESSVESNESNWLANTTSHRERLRRFRSRCTQVVQHPVQEAQSRHEEDGKIMLATMLIGPGKPRLVQIERPSSSNGSVRSHDQISHSSSRQRSRSQSRNLAIAPPLTPHQQQQREVSAFSPYDTPSITTPLAERSHAIHRSVSSPIEHTPFTASKMNLVPQPLAISRRVSSDSDKFVRGSFHHSEQVSTGPFSSQNGLSEISAKSRHTTATGLTFDNSNTSTINTISQKSLQSRDHSRLQMVLDVTTKAVEAFPQSMVYLDSAAVAGIRHSSTREMNGIHMANLSRIFPGAPEQLLSALAAWIIIDSYLVNLDQASDHNCVSTAEKLQGRFSFRKGHAPRRSSSMPTTISAFKSRPKPIRVPSDTSRSLRSFVSSHLSSSDLQRTVSRSGDSIHSIPNKARSVLGINRTDMCDLARETLVSRARALTISIGVIAQKLMEILRGSGGWDAQLWRSLKIMIKMTEENGLSGHHHHREQHMVKHEISEIDGGISHIDYEKRPNYLIEWKAGRGMMMYDRSVYDDESGPGPAYKMDDDEEEEEVEESARAAATATTFVNSDPWL